MLKQLLKITLIAAIICTGIFFAKDHIIFGSEAYQSFKAHNVESEDEKSEMGGAIDFFRSRAINPLTGKIDSSAVFAAYAKFQNHMAYKTGVGSLLKWTEMGPDNIGGRCRSIIFDKDSNNVIYAGGVTGGLFKSQDGGSTWKKVGYNPVLNQNICSITQGADGAIYYGTGEVAFLFVNGNGSIKGSGYSAPAYYGGGIYKSTDHGNTFKQLTATNPGSVPGNSVWGDISCMAADPTDPNRIYAGNDNSLMISTDGGTTWKVATGVPTNSPCKDIKMSGDGKIIYIVLAKGSPQSSTHVIYRSIDAGNTFTQIATKNAVPSSASGIELAIAPNNPNTVYASVANASNYTFLGVYRSDDTGRTWKTVAIGDANFNPFASQGNYDNAIAVDPSNSNKIYLAGLNMFSLEKTGTSVQTLQLTDWTTKVYTGGFINTHYVHADQHIILFDRAKPYPNMYVGTDGGVSKSTDVTNPATTSPTFFDADFGFNTTQFYGIGVGADAPTSVIGGAQDNGTVTVKKEGITLLNGAEIKGGDGGYCEISKLNPDVYFQEYVSGSLTRSFNQGKSWDGFFDKNIPAAGTGAYSFISWFSLWESANDITSIDSVIFTDPIFGHKAGETVQVRSANGVNFPYILTSNLPINSSIKVKDPTQSKFFVAANNEVWMTKDILNKSITPTFYRIASIPGFLPLMIRSTADGNTAFVAGTEAGGASIYRITGLSGKKYAYTGSTFNPSNIGIVTTKLFYHSGQVGTGVAIDENNPSHVLFCTGTYDGSNAHIYASTNAMDTNATFINVSGNMPSMPIYDVLINSHNPNMYFAATDLGVYSSINGGNSWAEENNGMERVPVLMLRQMKYSTKAWNGPYIFAATFGRGVFYSSTLTSGIDDQNKMAQDNLKVNVNIYPNPAIENLNISYNLPESSEVSISIYNMSGQQVYSNTCGRQTSGDHLVNIDINNMKQGTYFVKLKGGSFEQTNKIVVLKQ